MNEKNQEKSVPPNISTSALIEALQLQPHVEGGYFKRTFQADHREKIDTAAGPRYTLTSIFYLLTQQSPIGHWHLNKSDIIHYFHLGDPITYYLIYPDRHLQKAIMGPDPTQGHLLQLTVKGGVWKASHLESGDYGLISEAVAPGFEYQDMTLGKEEELMRQLPQQEQLIKQLSSN